MAQRQFSVLYFAPWVTIGGSDRNTVDWFRMLDSSRFRTHLATTQESPNELFDKTAQYADEAWDLPRLMVGHAVPEFLAQRIGDRRIDVVHVMNSRLGFDLMPALKRAFPHLRTVVQLHAEEHPEGTGYPRYVTTRYDPSVDAYSVISKHLRDRIISYGADAERVHIIGLGVDTDVFNPDRVTPKAIVRNDEMHILFPARLAWQKDPLQVVEIARRLREQGSGAVVHVVGDGELRPDMEASIARHSLEDRVLMHGYDLDMPRWYAATDVTLLPSRYEGIPLTLYESMAMGRPVVVADVGGIAELVDGETGFLIHERDDPDAFVRALRRLETDPTVRSRMGKAARERAVREFPVGRVAEGHARLYESLVATAPARARRADLSPFDDWWADDTTALFLAVTARPARAWLTVVSGTGAAAVRVGRILTTPLPGTSALTSGSESLGFAFTAPLPGMVRLDEVLPGHLDGLWRAAGGSGPPPPIEPRVDEALWVDAPYLLPERAPAPAVNQRRRRLVRGAPRWRQGR